MKSPISILALTALTVLAVSSLALAQPPGRGPCAALAGVPPEKQEQVIKLFTEGRQKIFDLESRKWNKQGELNALLASPKPESNKIEALAKEIGNLGSLIYQERVALQQRIAKETGVNLPLAGGYGHGHGGCGYGPGAGRGGYGPGPAMPPCCQPQ